MAPLRELSETTLTLLSFLGNEGQRAATVVLAVMETVSFYSVVIFLQNRPLLVRTQPDRSERNRRSDVLTGCTQHTTHPSATAIPAVLASSILDTTSIKQKKS